MVLAAAAAAAVYRCSPPGDPGRDQHHELIRGDDRVPGHPGQAVTAGERSASPVSVLEADDIVLAQIGPRLDFDQVQRLAADILQPVPGA